MSIKRRKVTDGFLTFDDLSINSDGPMEEEKLLAVMEEVDSQKGIEAQLARIEKRLRNMIKESEPMSGQTTKNKRLQEYYDKFEGKNPIKDYAEFALQCMGDVKRHLMDGNEGKFTALSTITMMDAYWMARIHLPEIKGNVVQNVYDKKSKKYGGDKRGTEKSEEAKPKHEEIIKLARPLLEKNPDIPYSQIARSLIRNHGITLGLRAITKVLEKKFGPKRAN